MAEILQFPLRPQQLARLTRLAQTSGNLYPFPDWVRDLLDKMADQPVQITRTEAKELWRAMFGAAGLRDLPKDRGQVIRRLPNSDDMLVLNFTERSQPFQPCWVEGRVHRGAVRIVLPSEGPGTRLLRAVQRAFGINTWWGSSMLASTEIADGAKDTRRKKPSHLSNKVWGGKLSAVQKTTPRETLQALGILVELTEREVSAEEVELYGESAHSVGIGVYIDEQSVPVYGPLVDAVLADLKGPPRSIEQEDVENATDPVDMTRRAIERALLERLNQ
jgi:hypothetical protein